MWKGKTDRVIKVYVQTRWLETMNIDVRGYPIVQGMQGYYTSESTWNRCEMVQDNKYLANL